MHPDWSRDVILAGLLDACEVPLFLLDELGELAYQNPALQRLLAQDGEWCRILAPPADVDHLGPVLSTMDVLTDGSTKSALRVLHVPLRGAGRQDHFVLGIVLPMDAVPMGIPWSSTVAERVRRLRRQLRERYQWDQFLATSPAGLRALAQARLAANAPCAAVLAGEPGTGRTMLARLIHQGGPRGEKAFACLSCDLIPSKLLREELHRWRLVGRPAAAGTDETPGTVFLRNVQSMPRELQAELAAALAASPAPEQPRVLAGCWPAPGQLVADGRLLDELYWRLATIVIEIPALRDRAEDIAVLAQSRLEVRQAEDGKAVRGWSDEVLAAWQAYPWPGNVAQLFAVVDEARERCASSTLTIGDLPPVFRTSAELQRMASAAPPKPLPLDQILESAERRLLQLAMRDARDNVSQAAERLGISRARLHRRLAALGLADRANATEGFSPDASTGSNDAEGGG